MGTASRGRKNSPGTNVRGSGSTWTSVFTWNQESGSRLSRTADITGEEEEGHKDGQHPRTVDPRTTIPRTARSAKPMTPQKTVLLPSADDRATQACSDEKSGHKNAHQRASPQQRRDLITRLDHERRDPALRHRLPHGALATQLVRRALGRGTRPVRPNHDSRHPPAQAGELLTRLLGDSRLSRQRRGHRAHQPDPAGTACGANREGVPRSRIEVASDPRFEDGIVLRIDVDVPALQDAHLVPVVRGVETLLREAKPSCEKSVRVPAVAP